MRQFNCVGERETHDYVVPEIISQLAQAESIRGVQSPVISLGNNSTRDFQYAGDAVRMAVLLLERGEFGQVYNMGSEQCIKIWDLAQMIGHLMYNNQTPITVVQDPARVRPWEIWHLQADNTKLYSVIGGYHHTPLKEALKKTISYFYANGSHWDW